ncbi:hypothetical protein [Streptomyces sp. JW3]|uniref:hypothetical protein n=1 Tax=Streptomyces sp. JW3 TaxID=3456955 RepID=UPI003FA4842D
MQRDTESLEAEVERVDNRPASGSAPPVLSVFSLEIPGNTAEYVQRLLSVIRAAVTLGATADFEEESLPIDGVPDWFVAIGSIDGAQPPEFAKRGCDAYKNHTGGQPWSLQNWLYRFDPDEDSRGWEWWDVVQVGPGRVHLWVDSWGESFFGCQELLWVAYTAGAARVDGPTVRRSDNWI